MNHQGQKISDEVLKVHVPAKINLFLHVLGNSSNGYHELESLVAFTEVGDDLLIEPADKLTFALKGPFSNKLLLNESNLVVQAAQLMGKGFKSLPGAKITLEKNLPIASGIGGGSADAAAVFSALNVFWRIGKTNKELAALGLSLGADVPVCIYGKTAFLGGIGEIIEPAPELPSMGVLLVNPNLSLSTASVFSSFDSAFSKANNKIESWLNLQNFITYLQEKRNDLELSAKRLAPEINEVLNVLENEPNCLLARLSGSGATCFGLFSSSDGAKKGKQSISQKHQEWWVRDTKFISSP